MKRPDKEILEINGTLNRKVLDYIAWLEGFESGVRDAAEWMTRMAKVKQPFLKAKAPVHPALNCGKCRFSEQIDSPEGADRKFNIICKHENVAAETPVLVAQHRAYGCGPAATLWEAKPQQEPTA